MKTPPCGKDCQERKPGCHDHCEKYKAWHEELERAKAYVRKENHVETNEKARAAGWRKNRYGSRNKTVK